MSDYEERVRQVVRGVLGGSLAHDRQTWTSEERCAFIDAIADRVASQLASASPVLSAEERCHLLSVRSYLRERTACHSDLWVAETATLDRLLGASR